MNINERRPWLEPDEPVAPPDALDRWMAAEELARQASTTPKQPPNTRPEPERQREPDVAPAGTAAARPDSTAAHESCVLCGRVFADEEFVFVGTVCGNCLDYGISIFWKPGAESAFRIGERCLLDVSDLWAKVASRTALDDDIVTEVEKRLTEAGRYVGTDGDRWFVYGGVLPEGLFEPDAGGSLHLTEYWSSSTGS
jgi:hypothetical protein